MTVATRLEKVEGRLTPRQAVRLWLQEAHAYPSLIAYAGWLKDQPLSSYPLVKLPEQVAAAIKEATRGQDRRQQDHALFEARREIAFLFKLVIAANELWYGQERAFDFAYLLLLEKSWHLKEYVDASEEGRPLPGYFDEHARVWRALAEGQLRQLLVLQEALEQASGRYLDGVPLLFPDAFGGAAEGDRGRGSDYLAAQRGRGRPAAEGQAEGPTYRLSGRDRRATRCCGRFSGRPIAGPGTGRDAADDGLPHPGGRPDGEVAWLSNEHYVAIGFVRHRAALSVARRVRRMSPV